jgi:hypothetical protein
MLLKSKEIGPLAGGACLAAALFGPASAAGAGDKLLAHRAVYDLSLGKTDESHSAPVAARGRIVYEFTGSPCEGWVTNFRQVTELQLPEGDPRMSDMRTSTFEEGDGSAFRFKSDTVVNGKTVESVDGRAKRSAGDGLSVDLSQPKPGKTDFASAAVFPTAQILGIVDAAKAGDRTAEIPIFDGSEAGQKVFDTMAVIGRSKVSDSDEPVAAGADALKGVARWPVSVSYFDHNKRDGAPNYILGFDLYENGVSSDLRIDYGSYVLQGKMTKFEPLPQKACGK